MLETLALNGHFFSYPNSIFSEEKLCAMCPDFLRAIKAVKTILFGIFLVINHVSECFSMDGNENGIIDGKKFLI